MIPKFHDIPYQDWENILNRIDVGIVIDDAEGYILWANESYRRITGVNIQKHIGKTAWDFKNDSDIRYINLNDSLQERAAEALEEAADSFREASDSVKEPEYIEPHK